MNTGQGLLVYVIVSIFVFAILIHLRIRIWSAIVLTLLIGQILLNILCNPSQIAPWSPNGESITSATALYIMIQLITPIIVLIYVVVKCLEDKIIIV